MELYFYEDRVELVECRDGTERHVGGVQIPPDVWKIVQSMELDWNKLPEESDEYELIKGNIVGVYLEEIGKSPAPYVVADVTEDPDTEEYSRIIVLENKSYEDIQKIGVSCGMRGSRADYKHDETSRYIAGDGVTVALVPDLMLADLLDADELRAHITSTII